MKKVTELIKRNDKNWQKLQNEQQLIGTAERHAGGQKTSFTDRYKLVFLGQICRLERLIEHHALDSRKHRKWWLDWQPPSWYRVLRLWWKWERVSCHYFSCYWSMNTIFCGHPVPLNHPYGNSPCHATKNQRSGQCWHVAKRSQWDPRTTNFD